MPPARRFLHAAPRTKPKHPPLLLLLVLLLEVVQLLHALDVLQLERLLRLPGVVDVGPVLPLDQVLGVARLLAGVEVGVGVSVRLHCVHGGGAARRWVRHKHRRRGYVLHSAPPIHLDFCSTQIAPICTVVALHSGRMFFLNK